MFNDFKDFTHGDVGRPEELLYDFCGNSVWEFARSQSKKVGLSQ